MVVSGVLFLRGSKAGDLFDSPVILGSCVATASIGEILLLLVTVQDCWEGETSYTAKGL